MDAKVLSVDVVVFNQTKSLPPLLMVHARGTASTSGWTRGRLSPYVYIKPPADGIWDFDFIATAPTGFALQVVTSIESELFVVNAPPWCRGVRVHASTNTLESTQTTEQLDTPTVLNPANWVPYPWSKGLTTMGADMSQGPEASAVDDVSPWLVVEGIGDSSRVAGDEQLWERPIKELIGAPVRVYRQGDMVTMDHRPDRVNIVLSQYSLTIAEIKMG